MPRVNARGAPRTPAPCARSNSSSASSGRSSSIEQHAEIVMRGAVLGSDCKRTAIGRFRLCETVLIAQSHRERRPGLRIISTQRHEHAAFGFRSGMPTKIVQCANQPQAGGTVFPVVFERVSIALLGICQTPAAPEQVAQIDVKFCAARLERDALPHQQFRLLNVPGFLAEQSPGDGAQRHCEASGSGPHGTLLPPGPGCPCRSAS